MFQSLYSWMEQVFYLQKPKMMLTAFGKEHPTAMIKEDGSDLCQS